MFYKLDKNNSPVKCTGKEWAEWYEPAAQSGRRIVAQDELDGSIEISTIFTGIDQGGGSGPPLLFETMTFLNGKSTGIAIRSETWEQADNQHRQMIRQVRKADEDE